MNSTANTHILYMLVVSRANFPLVPRILKGIPIAQNTEAKYAPSLPVEEEIRHLKFHPVIPITINLSSYLAIFGCMLLTSRLIPAAHVNTKDLFKFRRCDCVYCMVLVGIRVLPWFWSSENQVRVNLIIEPYKSWLWLLLLHLHICPY